MKTTISFPGCMAIFSIALLVSCGSGGGGGDAGVTRHTVTANAGAHGTIDPASRTVNAGDSTTFTITPDTGYSIASAVGCNGTISGNTYTTGAITNDCTVNVTFAINTYMVTASTGSGGSITPSSRFVSYGSTTTFTVTPLDNCSIESVSGCGGTLAGDTYTTGPVVSNCTVTVNTACGGWWTWTDGTALWDATGVYGTKGVADPANMPGGRSYAITWESANGDVWLFGGGTDTPYGYKWYDDLWKYEPMTALWTWMSGTGAGNVYGSYGTQGIAAAGNHPGSRADSAAWTDTSGNLWLFGGGGFDTFTLGQLNDVWKYDITTGLWAWMKGSKNVNAPGVYGTQGIADAANIPGARAGISWIDPGGNLWIYGGGGRDAAGNYGHLSDLWKYEPTSQQWTWISGSNAVNAPAVYGVQGVAAAGNTPGGRHSSAHWIDATGNLWLFGGEVGSNLWTNDLWKYDRTANLWTWMGGSTTTNASGVHGTKGVAAAGNIPGARYSAAAWVDAGGDAWIFGGYGMDGAGSNSSLNDLWKYDSATNLWIWMGGSQACCASGVYGTKGVAAAGNVPGARIGAATWTNASGNQCLFGGEYRGGGSYDDMWVHSTP